MSGDQSISWLMFFTLAAAVVIAGVAFASFLRSRSSREAASDALAGDGGSAPKVGTSGALPELAGVFAVLLVAMGLLFTGYTTRDSGKATAQAPTPAATVGSSAAVSDPNAPKPYQPANPTPDTRSSPTNSATGTGNEAGGQNSTR